MSAASPIYRNPPYVLGPEIFSASDLTEVVDWGLTMYGLDKIHDKSLLGKAIRVGVADTGRPAHNDIDEGVIDSKNFSRSFTDIDHNGHSTHVAGIIGARRNGKGVVGVAPEVEFVFAKVLGDDGSGDNMSVARGISYLAEQDCDVINLSLGGPYDRNIEAAVADAVLNKHFVICAAGNSGPPRGGSSSVDYPARLSSTVTVASHDKHGNISGFSSRGKEVHVACPGEDILSCWLGQTYRRISGTSMATPFFCGILSLLLADRRDHGLSMPQNNKEVIDLIKEVAVDRGTPGHDVDWGWGVVDIDKWLGASKNEDENSDESTQVIQLGPLKLVYPLNHENRTYLGIGVEW